MALAWGRFFSNVHEGPQAISKYNNVKFLKE